jgi:hypothetical protein
MEAIDRPDLEALKDHATELGGYKSGLSRDPHQALKQKQQKQSRGRNLLQLLLVDIFADVYGNAPLSSVNLVSVTSHMKIVFMRFEDKFRGARHPLWIETYEHMSPQLRS